MSDSSTSRAEKPTATCEVKICSKCGQEKPPTEFYCQKRGANGLRRVCKGCCNLARRDAYHNDPEYRDRILSYSRRRNRTVNRPWYWKNKVGIQLSLNQYERILYAQGGRCAKCGTDKPGRTDWNVDHDHTTKEVRGLLCWNCNSAIGKLGDNEAGLLQALDYLRNPPARKVLSVEVLA